MLFYSSPTCPSLHLVIVCAKRYRTDRRTSYLHLVCFYLGAVYMNRTMIAWHPPATRTRPASEVVRSFLKYSADRFAGVWCVHACVRAVFICSSNGCNCSNSLKGYSPQKRTFSSVSAQKLVSDRKEVAGTRKLHHNFDRQRVFRP